MNVLAVVGIAFHTSSCKAQLENENDQSDKWILCIMYVVF